MVPSARATPESCFRSNTHCEGSGDEGARSGDVAIDLSRRVVTKGGREVKLSRKEFDLLAELALVQGGPVPHEALLRAVWGDPTADIRYLRIYVGQVREKIETYPQHPTLLLAEPGFRYRLR